MGSYIRGYCAPKRKPHLLPALCALLRTAGHADGSPNPSNSNQGWMGEVAWVAKRPASGLRETGGGGGGGG